LKPVIVDPGLYLVEKTDMFFASQKRELPKAFKLFSGMLSYVTLRFHFPFSVFCIYLWIITNWPPCLLFSIFSVVQSFGLILLWKITFS